MSNIRVRFAPSPTGHLHIGGLRAALFNWLFARHFNGKFLLRIEDTDQERSTQEYTDSILSSLKWCNINYDEPLVIQSARIKEHQELANKMLKAGTAYRCVCTQQELSDRLGNNADQDGYTQYDMLCRDKNYQEDGERPFVIRFKRPLDQKSIKFKDLIRGEVEFDMNQLDDFILIRSDGSPMYNFVVVVDDNFMNISYVIRGEEHLANTPKQILIYQACNFSIPQFAHLPLILGADGKKLSKRDAATSVLDYKKEGFLPQALCNYLVRLGWSHGDQEIFSFQEMIQNFSLDNVQKKGAIFDLKKLEWFNTVYIKSSSSSQILEIIVKDFDNLFIENLSLWSYDQILSLIDLYKTRVKTIKEIYLEIINLYNFAQEYTIESELYKNQKTLDLLIEFYQSLENLSSFTLESISAHVKEFCSSHKIAFPDIAKPLRIALTGKIAAPGINELIFNLTKEEALLRINKFINFLKH